MNNLINSSESQQIHILHKMMPVGKIAGVIFCVVLFLPYVITAFSRGIEQAEAYPELRGPAVIICTEKGTEHIPADEYLCGILAQYYEEGYTREELKCLSILLRTNLICRFNGQQYYDQEYWNRKERGERWKSNFSNFEIDLKNIIAETSGKILLNNGKIEEITIPAVFHDAGNCDEIIMNEFKDYIIYQYF